jgi:hypothetical protein
MKKLIALSLCLGCLAAADTSFAVDFKKSKVTQVVNDVEIISAADQTKKSASVNDIFTMPDVLRTGPASRAELIAEDETVTRVGANTIFSFDPASRTIDLQQGSLLFHSPHGKGGGTIHTGSATASVLGSTLIVSATPNGGFKVLALEDDAEIKFLNGLKQKLDPGQMTFILPGGNQLAPIIIFRLDTLTQNSLLLKGFNQKLSSTPLILQEIQKQLKLLKSGKVTDTGLVVGDNANADQVEVLDFNTIQSLVNSPDVRAALGSDATINQPSLADATIPVPPHRIFLNPEFVLTGNSFFNGESFSGFAAHNISINTPAAHLDSLTVDLSPYAGRAEFDLVAANILNIEGSVKFSGFSADNTLTLIAGKQILFSPNITVQGDAGDFELSTPGALTLDGVKVVNDVGDVGLTSGSTITLKNGGAILTGGRVSLTAPTAVNLLNLKSRVEITSINTDPNSGQVMMQSDSGLTVSGTSIQTHFLTINSGDGILLDGNGQTFTAAGAGSMANFTAPNLITVNNADLSSFAKVNLAANTINLSDVAFGSGSSVLLKSLLGVLHLGSSVPGDVNFLQNVTYGGNPAQNYVNNGGGITVTTLH